MMTSTAARVALVSAISIAFGAIALAGPVAAANPHRCLVIDVTTGARFHHLQPAVDAAPAGAKLRVKGTCAGTTVITRDIRIVGHRRPGFGPAILDGNGRGSVITIGGVSDLVVTLKGLKIRNGAATEGGGIDVPRDPITRRRASMRLVDSIVSGNTASAGGGIFFGVGTFAIVDSIVRNNTSTFLGGGIYVGMDADAVTLRGTSVVRGNHARDGGGIEVDFGGRLLLRDRSSVDHNTADRYGGGIECSDCLDADLFDDAEIHHNSAGLGGGGLNSGGRGNGTQMGDRSSIHDNSAPLGGGVRLSLMNLLLSGTSSIRHNTATSAGGGAYLVLGSGLDLTDHSSIDHNATAGDGGGVAINGGNVSVADDASITANMASQGGGVSIEAQALGQVVLTGNGAVSGNTPDNCYPPNSVAGCAP
jgi:hypothetical protein